MDSLPIELLKLFQADFALFTLINKYFYSLLIQHIPYNKLIQKDCKNTIHLSVLTDNINYLDFTKKYKNVSIVCNPETPDMSKIVADNVNIYFTTENYDEIILPNAKRIQFMTTIVRTKLVLNKNIISLVLLCNSFDEVCCESPQFTFVSAEEQNLKSITYSMSWVDIDENLNKVNLLIQSIPSSVELLIFDTNVSCAFDIPEFISKIKWFKYIKIFSPRFDYVRTHNICKIIERKDDKIIDLIPSDKELELTSEYTDYRIFTKANMFYNSIRIRGEFNKLKKLEIFAESSIFIKIDFDSFIGINILNLTGKIILTSEIVIIKIKSLVIWKIIILNTEANKKNLKQHFFTTSVNLACVSPFSFNNNLGTIEYRYGHDLFESYIKRYHRIEYMQYNLGYCSLIINGINVNCYFEYPDKNYILDLRLNDVNELIIGDNDITNCSVYQKVLTQEYLHKLTLTTTNIEFLNKVRIGRLTIGADIASSLPRCNPSLHGDYTVLNISYPIIETLNVDKFNPVTKLKQIIFDDDTHSLNY